jgi:hypothetical protein
MQKMTVATVAVTARRGYISLRSLSYYKVKIPQMLKRVGIFKVNLPKHRKIWRLRREVLHLLKMEVSTFEETALQNEHHWEHFFKYLLILEMHTYCNISI